MATLTVTVGLPGSGKSTAARQLRTVKAEVGPVACVSRDDLRDVLHGVRDYTARHEREVTVAQHAMVEALLRAGTDVIVHDTNLRPDVMQSWRNIADRTGADLVVWDEFLTVPVPECVARDARRAGRERVGERVILDLHTRYLAAQEARR